MASYPRKPAHNKWVKKFLVGPNLSGYDKHVPKGLCSWSKSKLDEMKGVELWHDGHVIEILGLGNYWQSDTLVAPMQLERTVYPMYETRRIQKQVTDKDVYLVVQKLINGLKIETLPSAPAGISPNQQTKKVSEEDIGKWLTIELDADTLEPRWFLSEERI